MLPVGWTRTSAELVEPGARAERARDRRGRDAAGLDIGADAEAAQLAALRRLLRGACAKPA